MKVDFLAEQLCARVPGGTGRYAAQLLRCLSSPSAVGGSTSTSAGVSPGARLDNHLDVRAVVGRACPAVDEITSSVHTLGLPGPALARLWERGLPPALGAGRDIVHAPTLLVPPVRQGAALVVTIHDVVPWTHPETLTPRGTAFHRRMGARAAREADLIITPTQHVARQVREVLAPRGRVEAISLGVTPLPVPSDAPARRARLGLTDHPYVLFVGTHEPRKGLDVLVTALSLPELAATGLDLVVVGGSGWGGVDVPSLAASAGVTDRVHLLRGIDDVDLAAVYDASSALVLPSRSEGFGIPVVEALSHGIPVVTSDDPALLETAAGFGEVAPVGDAEGLARAVAVATSGAPHVRERAHAGRRHAATVTWERAALRTTEAYRSVTTER